jgi:hypothetical protein
MDLLVKTQSEFSAVSQRARADLAQLETRLCEIFESEISKIDQKYQAKYFNYFLNKPTSLLKPALSSGAGAAAPLKPQTSNPFVLRPMPSSQPTLPATQPLPSSSQTSASRPTLKRSRSAFGEELPVGPVYSALGGASEATLLAEDGPLFMLHTDASPPCVRPRISANLTPLSPKVTKAALAQAEQALLPRLPSAPKEDDQYSVTSYSETDAEHKAEQDERRRKRRAKKRVPTWCKDWQYMAKLQQHVDPDAIFQTLQAFPKCDLKKIFGDKDKYDPSSSRPNKKHRGSSGNWGIDGLTDLEIVNYKKLMGQIPGNNNTPQIHGKVSVLTSNYELSLNSIPSKIN